MVVRLTHDDADESTDAQMNDHAGTKLLFANLGAWLGTIISLQNVQVVLAILSGVASLGVSVLSMIWILKKLKALEKGVNDKP